MAIDWRSIAYLITGAVVVLIGAYLKIQGHGTTVIMIGLIIEVLAIIGFIFKYCKKKSARQ